MAFTSVSEVFEDAIYAGKQPDATTIDLSNSIIIIT